MSDFDSAFFNDLIAYFRKEKNISDNTLNRKLGFLKSFLNWCLKNDLNVKENTEMFFVNERFLIKPEYIINNKVFVDILKNGEYNETNIDNYKNCIVIPF